MIKISLAWPRQVCWFVIGGILQLKVGPSWRARFPLFGGGFCAVMMDDFRVSPAQRHSIRLTRTLIIFSLLRMQTIRIIHLQALSFCVGYIFQTLTHTNNFGNTHRKKYPWGSQLN